MTESGESEQGRSPKMLGERIRAWRLRRGMTQPELARKAGVSRGYVSELEHGHYPRPGLDTITRIADALGFASIAEFEKASVMQPLLDLDRIPVSDKGPPTGLPAWQDISDEDVARVRGYLPLPVYWWGSLGDLSQAGTQDEPVPDRRELPPLAFAEEIGRRGFAVRIRGDAMVGHRPNSLVSGDYCWVAPGRHYRLGMLVAARVEGADDPDFEGNLVAVFRRDGDSEFLDYEPAAGERRKIQCRSFTVYGPIVRIEHVGMPPE